ncbi:hypothetical protein M0M57_10695 [Flavobacterium azooxidireducens]|uniref:YD repeat-containing protein n=1 Tax=Flavobacterium azooxidireducens TaxID=1871076 RepID=A0ABY4KCQ5_9FLAO|nr:hypothetical protein [Flavobacterium azooxidireducens]UPQ78090.1 hypothetical protein M0M57_10695 [Flavobacterium azooxidireducens]
MKINIITAFLTLLLFSCSNDDSSEPVVETKFYPKKIDYFSKDAQGVETFYTSTTFSYNENEQVSSINYQGFGNINFNYNSNGLPSKIVVISSAGEVVNDFEYNGDRIVRFKQNDNTYNVGYNATTNTYSYTNQSSTYSFTLNSAKDLTKRVWLNNSNQTTITDHDFFYKNDGFGFLHDIDYPIAFYLHFIHLGFDFDSLISFKPLEKITIINSNFGNYFIEHTNILNADNYVIESLLTSDNSGAGTIVRFEYQEL